jgi:hypothetical protein
MTCNRRRSEVGMQTMKRIGFVMVVALGAFANVGCGAAAPDEQSDDPVGDEVTATSEEALSACNRWDVIYPQTRDADRYMIERGLDWVDHNVMYSQAPPYHDGWRRDCSGFVSMSWKLVDDKPGLVTWTMNQASHGIEMHDLRPGDALDIPHYHVFMFAGWANHDHTKMCTLEEYDYGHPASIRLRDRSDVVAAGYHPIRRDANY